jgi:hypothetical protein
MSLFAVCASSSCDYRIQLQDSKTGSCVPTPTACPKCKSPIISTCPWCNFPLFGKPLGDNPRCLVCKMDIRRIFALRRMRTEKELQQKASYSELRSHTKSAGN